MRKDSNPHWRFASCDGLEPSYRPFNARVTIFTNMKFNLQFILYWRPLSYPWKTHLFQRTLFAGKAGFEPTRWLLSMQFWRLPPSTRLGHLPILSHRADSNRRNDSFADYGHKPLDHGDISKNLILWSPVESNHFLWIFSPAYAPAIRELQIKVIPITIR